MYGLLTTKHTKHVTKRGGWICLGSYMACAQADGLRRKGPADEDVSFTDARMRKG